MLALFSQRTTTKDIPQSIMGRMRARPQKNAANTRALQARAEKKRLKSDSDQMSVNVDAEMDDNNNERGNCGEQQR